ncbi:MAG: hypothetical protein Q4G59_08075, partial [Planctomycetia bacterium]|nr:hypothetical protein [Planctomycetia bacterium]
MGITDNESLDDKTKAASKTRLQRVRDFIGATALGNESESRPTIVHELQCNRVGESLVRDCSIEPGEDWLKRLTNWLDTLRPEGKESRLAEQLIDVIEREKNHSLVAIVLMTDGCNNIGVGNESLLERLKTSPCPVHVVAVGERTPAFELGVATLRAPSRSRLQSEIPVSIELVSRGVLNEKETGTECTVDLFMIAQDTSGSSSDNDVPVIEPKTKPVASLPFYMSSRGELYASESDAVSATAAKTRTVSDKSSAEKSSLKLQCRVKATSCGQFVLVAQLRNSKVPVMRQSKAFTPIEVFDKKDKILLVAGGPLRDFQFFESRLKRSADVSTDVYLAFAKRFYHLEPLSKQGNNDSQTTHHSPNAGENNFTQERFTARFLSDYDAIVAFDPDWNEAFTPSELDAIEEWVARHGGGLIVSAGPVFAGQQIDGWTQSAKGKIVRSLYPVRFFAEGSRVESSFSTALPRRVRLRVKEAMESGPFANIGQDTSFDWSAFPGFYGALPVEAVKPAATLWATLDDPSQQTQGNNRLAVVFASQRYGAGRVFYIGTTELWRLRMVDESLPDRLLSNLIQYVTEGRREKMSPFGRLSVDQEVCQPGTTVAVQAVLNDVNGRPLVLENAFVEAISPQGNKTEIKLVPRKGMPGVYDGSVIAMESGRWKMSCPVPGTNESLHATFLVKQNDLESPPSYRDESFLREIVAVTGGQYMNADSAKSSDDLTSLLESLPAFQRVAVEDRIDQQIVRTILLAILCLLFLTEWLSRRIMGLV